MAKKDLVKEISTQVKKDLIETVQKITPWFFQSLPSFYYRITPKEEQIEHLHTVISLNQTQSPSATLRSADGSKVTFVSIMDRRGQLLECLESLTDTNLRSATVHCALKGNLNVATLCSEISQLKTKSKKIQNKIREIKKGLGKLNNKQKIKVEDFLAHINQEYVSRYEANMICRHIKFYLQIEDYETVFSLDNERDAHFSRVSLCSLNPPKTGYLLKILRILTMHNLDINRLYANVLNTGRGEVILITTYVASEDGKKFSEDSFLWKRLKSELQIVKWVRDDELAALIGAKDTKLNMRKVNFLRAAAVFAHQFLSKMQRERFTSEVVKKSFLCYPQIADLLVDYFYARLHPNIDRVSPDFKNLDSAKQDNIKKSIDAALGEADRLANGDIHDATVYFIDQLLRERRRQAQNKILSQLKEQIKDVGQFVNKEVFNTTIHFIDHILKTNFFIESNIGLAFRMDPKVLDKRIYHPLPFGFFFFCGRGYKGYHVRFKDMSRGGFRLVRSRDKEHYDFESARAFDEVFGLSKAQQLKNKDIPEGGSKAIALLRPGANLNLCVECAIDSLLDLIVTDENNKLHPRIVDYYGKEEILYLGPDENLSDDRIEWIVQRAKKKKYKYPNAFMSSKPGVGINHKKYGVTSQGVHVYVEACLQYLKINPQKDPFTVRIVGGPDGDVAGNEIKILIKDHPQAEILAISDGGGAAYDSQGLNHQELLRLVREGKTIIAFNKKLLSKDPNNFVVDANTVEGRKIRDQLQWSNIVKTDLLIPAGGRPNTINSDNWRKSLDKNGKPVFKAVVEGANLFLTNDARLKLEEKGTLVIKDSSANKGGVICSSYEIIASLILSEEEFTKIREKYVSEVVEILKEKAQLESKLLFREYSLHHNEISLTDLSSRISQEINELTDSISSFIRKESQKEENKEHYLELLKKHCPKVLVEKYGDRITTDIPEEHRLSILASRIASYVVYNEGLGWIKSLYYPDICKVIKIYLEQDRLVEDYIQKILSSDLPGKETIAKILEHNARKELTRERLS